MLSYDKHFANIHQLSGCGQYGIQDNIVNVPFNIKNAICIPLITSWWFKHNNLHQEKLEYKHAYISRYVQPNMVIKVFNDMCKTPLYKTRGLNFKKWVDLYIFH